MHTDRTDSTTPDLTAVAALNGPLEQAGWTLDVVTEMSAGSVDYLYLHPSGRQVTAVTAPAGEPVELTLTGLTLDQAVGAVTGAGYAPAVEVEPTTAPTPDLLAAVRQVIDAGRLEWGNGLDVDRVQGEAHAALVRAYQAATGSQPAVDEPDLRPVYRVTITDGTPFTTADGYPVTGYVAGLCGHRVAGSEWRAGLRVCERCPRWSGPVTVDAPASATDIADAVLAALRPYVNVDDWSLDVDVDLAAGTVEITEEFSGDVIARGTVASPVKPDYWLALAADIHRAAEQVAALAGQPKPPYVALSINVANPGNKLADIAGRVDAIAAAFGLTAETQRTPGGYHERTARGQMGQLRLSFYGYVPAPEQSELERLRAELAELRAAQGGGTR